MITGVVVLILKPAALQRDLQNLNNGTTRALYIRALFDPDLPQVFASGCFCIHDQTTADELSPQ